uniref:Reverse transcriptase domain-containing protein n=1 Tax=Tanacetum cinerariifolium TaxID=118510 RepID=A0A6L2NQT9_TANCI|nr:hypothetical protein [Tanacetum cinerariifolium]
MGDENPIRTLRDYSKPSHEGYMNTIELPAWNYVDYMEAHTERMRRFKNAIFMQREGINSIMIEMFRLLKELTTSRTPEKVFIREEAKFLINKNMNSITRTKGEEERSNKKKVTPDNTKRPTETEVEMLVKEAKTRNEAEDGSKNKSIKTPENEEVVEAPGNRVGKKKGKTYKVLPRRPVHDVILKKKITKKEDVRGNFKIHCNVGGQKGINTLVDQGSDVNVMPYTTYMKFTDERPAKTHIRLSLDRNFYIYPLGIVEDVLVEVAKHIYPVDFVILDIKENEKWPFILGTPFLGHHNSKIEKK